MAADTELRVVEDLWMQMLALLALVSGIFTAVNYFPRRAARATEPPVSAAARTPTADPTTPRTGPWIVDARGGPDAQFTTLGAAVAAAKDGDTIVLRPGVYNESVAISRSLVVSGGGTSAAQVQLTNSSARTLSVSAGRVFLKHLTVTNPGTSVGAAIELTGGSLMLEQVTVGAAGDGVVVRGGELEASNSTLEGRIALSVLGRAKVSLLQSSISARVAGVRADGMAEVRIEGAQLKASQGSAVEASEFAKVRMTDVALTGSGAAAVTARTGAEIRISKSKISENRGCGVSVDGASIFVERVRFSRQRCGVGFLGPGSLETIESEYSELELGPLAIKPGHEREVSVRGSGNVGLTIPK